MLLIPVALSLGRLAQPTVGSEGGGHGAGRPPGTDLISNVRGEDPSVFAAVAVPTNLLIFGGFVVLAVALKRSGTLPTCWR